jgi:hypothetical protein
LKQQKATDRYSLIVPPFSTPKALQIFSCSTGPSTKDSTMWRYVSALLENRSEKMLQRFQLPFATDKAGMGYAFRRGHLYYLPLAKICKCTGGIGFSPNGILVIWCLKFQ